MEHLIRLIPLIAALSFVIYMIFRMNRSMRLQKESVDRQKSGWIELTKALSTKLNLYEFKGSRAKR